MAFVACLALACTRSQNSDVRIKQALDIYSTHPDSALAILQGVDKSSLNEKDLATYSLVYSMALDKSGVDVDNDSLLRIAYDYYHNHKDNPLYPKCMYYLGCFYELNDSVNRAESCYSEAMIYADKCFDHKISYQAREMLARSLKQSDTDEALALVKEELKIIDEFDGQNRKNKTYALLTLAEVYLEKSEYVQCHAFLDSAYILADSLQDKELLRCVCQDKATAYLIEDKADSAFCCINGFMESYQKENSQIEFLRAIALSRMDSLQQGEEGLLNLLREGIPLEMKCLVYRELKDISFSQCDIFHARLYSDSVSYIEDLLYQQSLEERSKSFKEALAKEHEISRHVREEAIHTFQMRLFFIIVIVIFFIVFFLYLVRKRELVRRHEIEQQRSKMEAEVKQEKLRHELVLKEERIDLMRERLVQKMNVMEKIEDSRKEGSFVRFSTKDWKDIEAFLNGVDNLFVKRITAAYPNMTEKDVRFCMLLRLGLSTKDLSSVYAIHEQSVKQKLYNFKSKMGICDPNLSVRQFLQNF